MSAYEVVSVPTVVVTVLAYCVSLHAAFRESAKYQDAVHQPVFIGNQLWSRPQRILFNFCRY